MKISLSDRTKDLTFAAIGAILILIVLVNLLGLLFGIKDISVFSYVSELNNYQVRSGLLTDALDQTGVCAPEAAAELWAGGLKARSGALQYAAMDQALKEKYAAQLNKKAPNWVTGLSSPWVEGYQIAESKKISDDTYRIKLTFTLATSTGPAGAYNASLTVKKIGAFWRVTAIQADEGLYPYTLFEQ